MIVYSLYAIYDKRAKCLAPPFISANDEVAKQKYFNTLKQMDEEKIQYDRNVLTVLNLGYYRASIIENKDKKRITKSYEPCIFKNDEIYDIFNPFEDIKIREEYLPEINAKGEEEECQNQK